MFETVLFNQTLPTAYKSGKHPTVAPAHALKTLLRQIVPDEIENNASQTFSRFIQRANIHDWRLVYLSPLVAEPFLRDVFSTINYVQDSISLIGADFPVLHLSARATLDLDSKNKADLLATYRKALRYGKTRVAETSKGYHLRTETEIEDPLEIIRIRRILGDDPKRIEHDLILINWAILSWPTGYFSGRDRWAKKNS